MFKYILDKTDGIITREEMVIGISFEKVKPANEIGLEECTMYEEESNVWHVLFAEANKSGDSFL